MVVVNIQQCAIYNNQAETGTHKKNKTVKQSTNKTTNQKKQKIENKQKKTMDRKTNNNMPPCNFDEKYKIHSITSILPYWGSKYSYPIDIILTAQKLYIPTHNNVVHSHYHILYYILVYIPHIH